MHLEPHSSTDVPDVQDEPGDGREGEEDAERNGSRGARNTVSQVNQMLAIGWEMNGMPIAIITMLVATGS